MQAKPHFLTLARYNLWATRLLVDSHIALLPDEEYRRDVGLFFGSVHGALNHLLVGGDMVWFPRFAEGKSPQGVKLSDRIEDDRSVLRSRLVASAERWIALVETFDESRYDATLAYTTMRGTNAVLPFAATLAHVFNHGTHHRGQITTALSALGKSTPELDLVYMLQQEQAASAA